MVVEEITLPSGFKADLTSVRNVNGLKQKEADLDRVALYFDRVSIYIPSYIKTNKNFDKLI